MSVRLRISSLLRRIVAGAKHDIRTRRQGDTEGLARAFDPTLPTRTADYHGPESRDNR
jgi:hypothetical protein